MGINIFDYISEFDIPTVYRNRLNMTEIERKECELHLDHRVLFPKLIELHKYSQRIYCHLLTLLVHNNKPIVIRASQLKLHATPMIKRSNTFENYILPLIHSGLIFRTGRNTYYINPVYAWKDGSEVCFDPKYVPVLPESESEVGQKE